MNEDAFAACRPRLFGIAYRMLGEPSEAEDVVQDAWLRWRAPTVTRAGSRFLATVMTNLPHRLRRRAPAARSTSGPGCRSPSSPNPGHRSQDEQRDTVTLGDARRAGTVDSAGAGCFRAA